MSKQLNVESSEADVISSGQIEHLDNTGLATMIPAPHPDQHRSHTGN